MYFKNVTRFLVIIFISLERCSFCTNYRFESCNTTTPAYVRMVYKTCGAFKVCTHAHSTNWNQLLSVLRPCFLLHSFSILFALPYIVHYCMNMLAYVHAISWKRTNLSIGNLTTKICYFSMFGTIIFTFCSVHIQFHKDLFFWLVMRLLSFYE